MRRIAANLLCAAWCLAGCCACTRATSLDPGEERVTGLRSIPALKALARGGATPLRQEIAVQGVVTANDRYGEFERRIVLEDAEGGLTIALEAQELYRRYPVGRRLTVYCNGLVLLDYGGSIELVADPDALYGAVGIPAADLDRYLHAAAPADEAPRPAERRIDELTAAAVDTYVRIGELRFTAAGSWCRRDPLTGRSLTTEHTATDRAGRTLTVRVPSTVRYADEPLPTGEGTLCGIVRCFDGRCALCVSDRGIFFGQP